MWTLYAQWRFRDLEPDEAYAGEPSPWRSRIEGVLAAFAIQAAQLERSLMTLIEGLASGDEEA